MPTMPKPPKAGSNAGMQGITHGGIHGPKTAATDLNPHKIQTAPKNPNLKAPKAQGMQPSQPKQPKQPKAQSALKTENCTCTDCGEVLIKNSEYIGCACFKAMTTPLLKKTEEGVIIRFDESWDFDSRWAFFKTLRK